MSNKYLEKIALTRLVKEIAKAPQKFHVRNLVNKGALRNVNTYAEGISKGNSNLIKKHNISISADEIKPGAGQPNYFTYQHPSLNGGRAHIRAYEPGFTERLTSPLNSVFDSKHADKINHEMTVRHEIYEAIASNKAFNPTNADYSSAKRFLNGGGNFYDKHGQHSGAHMSPSILLRESNDIRKIPHKNEMANWVNHRHDTGEAEVIHNMTGKKYGVDEMKGKDFKNAEATTPNHREASSFESIFSGPKRGHSPNGKADFKDSKSHGFSRDHQTASTPYERGSAETKDTNFSKARKNVALGAASSSALAGLVYNNRSKKE